MKRITGENLNLDAEVLNIALEKLQNEGYITGFATLSADNDRFYIANTSALRLTRDGIEYIEKAFGIQKELSASDKLKYIIKKCGVFGLQALKALSAETLKGIADIF